MTDSSKLLNIFASFAVIYQRTSKKCNYLGRSERYRDTVLRLWIGMQLFGSLLEKRMDLLIPRPDCCINDPFNAGKFISGNCTKDAFPYQENNILHTGTVQFDYFVNADGLNHLIASNSCWIPF